MSEFNPINERLKKQYEETLLHSSYREKSTVAAVWRAINKFEDFTGRKDFSTFSKEQAKGFKCWLEKQENIRGETLSLSTKRSTLHNIREFFKWLAMHPKFSRKLNIQAIAFLQLSQNEQRASYSSKPRPIPTVDEVNKVLVTMPNETDSDKRNRAIIAFTALTGVRDAALVSLKMKDVDIKAKQLWQDPKHVKTKFRKSIMTYFMCFDPIWEEIVIEWISHAREILGFVADHPLFPKELIKNNPENLCFENFGLSREHWANATPVVRIFKEAFEGAGLLYHNPHSFRNMLVDWAMENCSQKEFKAISQNLGHENVPITYNAYAKLSIKDQKKSILGIGKGKANLRKVTKKELMEELIRRT